MSQVMCPPGSIVHTIVAGDTCFALARRYGTTVQAIIAANPGLDCNNLQVARMICIPGQPVECPSGTTAYVIKAGDTCFAIARTAGITVQALINANPGLNCNNLQIGQTICVPTGVPGGCPEGTISYVIKAGDTCFALAQTAGITVQQLIAANPGLNCNNLQIGQTICIPVVTPPPPPGCPTGTRAHVIVAGDTCWRLAQQNGTTVDAIIAANPGINCNNLQIGQTICIPVVTPPPTGCPAGTRAHVIVAGDTCWRLAQQNGTTVDAIIAANPGINCNNLRIGSTICIP